MKLRFRGNTLRLRVNRPEVETLASGAPIEEDVVFPNQQHLRYVVQPGRSDRAEASFEGGVIRIGAPLKDVQDWARDDCVGLYFDFPGSDRPLKVSIEKDLECVDGAPEEVDPYAFPRKPGNNC